VAESLIGLSAALSKRTVEGSGKATAEGGDFSLIESHHFTVSRVDPKNLIFCQSPKVYCYVEI